MADTGFSHCGSVEKKKRGNGPKMKKRARCGASWGKKAVFAVYGGVQAKLRGAVGRFAVLLYRPRSSPSRSVKKIRRRREKGLHHDGRTLQRRGAFVGPG